MEIPRKIFQTWKTKTIQNNILHSWQFSWKLYNPSYEYIIWDDTDNRNFIKENFSDFLEIYDSYDMNIKRVDTVRYFYLLKFGGIYADLDFECLKSFDNIIESGELAGKNILLGTLGRMDNEKYQLHKIPNALMISKPGEDFWKLIIQVMKGIDLEIRNSLPPELVTGPCLLGICYDFYMNRKPSNLEFIKDIYKKNIFEGVNINFSSVIGILPPDLIYPINWDNADHNKYNKKLLTHNEALEMFPNSYAVTYWMHSWSK